MRKLIFIGLLLCCPVQADLLDDTELLIAERNFYAAVAKASEAVAFYQDDETLTKLYLLRGQAQRERRNYSQAFADFEVAYSINPESTVAVAEYGNALAAGYAGDSIGEDDWVAGEKLLRQAAEIGDVEAQYRLAINYLIRRGDTAQISKAIDLLEKAANQSHIDSLVLLAQFYQRGQYVARDPVKSLHLFRILSALHHPDGRFYLAVAHYTGQGVDKDVSEYERLTKLAAEQWHLISLESEAESLSGLDDLAASSMFFRAADLGYVPAKINIGLSYLRGFGVKQNFEQAWYWFNQAKQVPQAQEFLGVMSLLGLGIAADQEAAFSYFLKASGLATGRIDQQSYAHAAVLAATGIGTVDSGFYDTWRAQLDLLTSESELNSAVWALSTNPISTLNRPKIALELALRLQAITENPAYLDSVAAAYAINGDFKKAKNLQKEVVKTLEGTREWAESKVRHKTYKRKRVWVEDYKPYFDAPKKSQRLVAKFTGEIVRPSKRGETAAISVGEDATFGVPILVKEIESGSLPYSMQKNAFFYVHSLQQLSSTCPQQAFLMPVGINTFELSQQLDENGWQYRLMMHCAPASSEPNLRQPNSAD